MFVTNTLGNPNDEEGWIPGILGPIANSRKEANKIKREEPITVVIGNPPYREKAKGQGSWIESGAKNEKQEAPLLAWMPPTEWGVGVFARHLRNLYVFASVREPGGSVNADCEERKAANRICTIVSSYSLVGAVDYLAVVLDNCCAIHHWPSSTLL